MEGRLVLSASGWTYEYTFVLYDYGTESLWYPLEPKKYRGLQCISGPLANRTLKEIPSTQTRWSDWVALHPGSMILRDPDQ